jgi:transposase
LADLYGQPVADHTIITAGETIAGQGALVQARIKAYLIATGEPVHFDETGTAVSGRLQWVQVASTDLVTYLTVHAKRGRQALDEIGILPVRRGKSIHDDYASYFQYPDTDHGLCNAHHLRQLIFIHERYQQPWAETLGHLLVEIKTTVDAAKRQGFSDLTVAQRQTFDRRYDELIAQGLAANPPPASVNLPPKKRGRPDKARLRTSWTGCNATNLLSWLLWSIFRCHLTTTRPNATCAWSNSSKKCRAVSAPKPALISSARSGLTFRPPVSMAKTPLTLYA